MKLARGGEKCPVKERISQKLTPEQTILAGRVAAVVIEVCGEQPEVDVEVRLHAIIVLSLLACRLFLSF